jgi:uncharacterized protein related to proFAR isomerase
MATDIQEIFTCSHGYREHHSSIGSSLRPISDAAQRLQALLEVADMLTEKPELTEIDIIALDVLLDAGREQASEIIRRIRQLSAAACDAGAMPRQ